MLSSIRHILFVGWRIVIVDSTCRQRMKAGLLAVPSRLEKSINVKSQYFFDFRPRVQSTQYSTFLWTPTEYKVLSTFSFVSRVHSTKYKVLSIILQSTKVQYKVLCTAVQSTKYNTIFTDIFLVKY